MLWERQKNTHRNHDKMRLLITFTHVGHTWTDNRLRVCMCCFCFVTSHISGGQFSLSVCGVVCLFFFVFSPMKLHSYEIGYSISSDPEPAAVIQKRGGNERQPLQDCTIQVYFCHKARLMVFGAALLGPTIFSKMYKMK